MKCIRCGIKEAEKNRRICCSCRYIQKKTNNPILTAFTSLRNHAKERGKEFTLTIEDFTEFCVKSNYINKKGIAKNSYHIDRIKETEGYVKGNIQLLTNSENVKKYVRFVGFERGGSKKFTTSISVDLNDKELIKNAPF